MSYVFHDSPSRREHFIKETQATVFLLYFCTTRYLVFFSILNDSLQILHQTFLWKIHAENMHQKLDLDSFLILLNNPKQLLHARNSFKNKVF